MTGTSRRALTTEPCRFIATSMNTSNHISITSPPTNTPGERENPMIGRAAT